MDGGCLAAAMDWKCFWGRKCSPAGTVCVKEELQERQTQLASSMLITDLAGILWNKRRGLFGDGDLAQW